MGLPLPERSTRLEAWGLRLALILNAALSLSNIGLFIMALRQGLMWRADFSAFYTAWVMVRDGLGSQLYDFDLQTRIQQAILQGKSFAGGLLPYNYPPHLAVLLAPLGWLSHPAAFAVWTLGQLALLIWLLLILNRLAAGWTRTERWMMHLAVLALTPLLLNFLLGAFSLLMLVSLLLFVEALQKNRQSASGLWLAVGMFKPQVWVLPAALLAFVRRWKALLTAAAVGAVLFVSTTLVIGWQPWLEYPRLLLRSTGFYGIYGIEPGQMYNLKGTLALMLHSQNPELINRISLLAWFVSLVVTFFLWRGAWQPEAPGFQPRMALTLTLSILFNLHTNPQDGLLLVAPAVLFYDYLRRQDLPRRAYVAFILSCPLIFMLSRFVIQDRLPIQLPVIAMAGFALWISLALKNIPKAL
jgi:hypothetical protein